jgi:hypothetical protein
VSLREAAGLVHDAFFQIEDVEHDQSSETLIIPFAQTWEWGAMLSDPAWRDAPRTEFVRKTWRYREERVPFMRGTLRIAAVQSYRVEEAMGDSGVLLDVRYDSDAGMVVVESVSGELHARVRRLDVAAELRNELALYVRRRRGFLRGESEVPLREDTQPRSHRCAK